MERVLGIGGYFMRAADPAAMSAWYRDCLGLDALGMEGDDIVAVDAFIDGDLVGLLRS